MAAAPAPKIELHVHLEDGAIDAKERTGVEVRLTPDIPRNLGPEVAIETARYAIRYRERGIVGLGLGGPEDSYPGAPFERAFQMAKDGGLGSVPHAARLPAPRPCARPSTSCTRTGSGTASARPRIPGCCASLPPGASCAMSARFRTSAPEPSVH
jgi:hypothetical protein